MFNDDTVERNEFIMYFLLKKKEWLVKLLF